MNYSSFIERKSIITSTEVNFSWYIKEYSEILVSFSRVNQVACHWPIVSYWRLGLKNRALRVSCCRRIWKLSKSLNFKELSMPASIFPMTSSTGASPGGRPSFRRMSRSLSADPDIPLVVLNVRRFHAEAYKYISEALKIDEEGGKKVKVVSMQFFCCWFSSYGQVWWETTIT